MFDLNKLFNDFAKQQLTAIKASRESEQMVFPRGDFAHLTRKDYRDVAPVPSPDSDVARKGGC